MRISDILSICVRNLTRRKLRTFLTALGVVIGVGLIIIAISIGIGLTMTYEEQLASWGDLTVIDVYNWNSKVTLDDAAIAKIQALDGVEIATPFYQNWDLNMQLTAKNGRYRNTNVIYGVYPEALELLGYELKEGSYLKDGDRPYSLVVGENFAYRFYDTKKTRNNRVDPYPDENGRIKDPFVDIMKDKLVLTLPSNKYDGNGKPIGKDIVLKPTVAGVMLKNDANWEATNYAFMDINEMKGLIEKYNRQNGIKTQGKKIAYENAKVKCVDVDAVAAVQEAITEMGFDNNSMNDSREYMQKQALAIQLVLGGLAGFSLLVAAIGIANTMIMSIYERTREIGVMKVIGAEVRDIRVMFLLEAGMIGLLGGILGVALSFGGSWAFNNFAAGAMGAGSKLSVIPLWLVLVALGFSILVGVVFGFLPANRAVKISALEAIKHD
ncbi:MAG: ABC transporter permease [Angelakisella sp.]|jgi:ABC-type antimicrobial peptide transport system permease subunit|nr:ABC transporter permease [Angelakisella sp.]MCI9528991.1 ABC transporter permease [Angelakisella sp.]